MSLFARAADYFGPTPEELAAQEIAEAEQSWTDWLTRYYAPYTRDGFAEHHEKFWAWVWAMQRGLRPPPYVAVWPRGGAKSTSAELAVVALGARGRRRYVLYVCATQELADDHVANIGTLLESNQLAADYPGVGNRLLSKYGSSKGWRRNRLRTASGFTIDAIGLDTAARGVKLEDQRPDLLVIDDIDSEDDTLAIIRKKIGALTRKLMPAGSTDLAVLAIQNLVHGDSIFSQLVDGRADFLADRVVNGPVPAVHDLTYVTDSDEGRVRVLVTGGRPTWAGQSLAVVQGQIATWGLQAFLTEAQHDVARYEGAWLDRDVIDEHRVLAGDVPVLPLIVTGVDPATTSKTTSNETGIVTAGVDQRGEGFVLDDASGRYTPDMWGRRVWEQVLKHGSQAVVVEDNAGGDMCEHTLRVAWKQLEREQLTRGRIPGPMVPIVRVHPSGANESKWRRAMPIGALYRQGRIHHVTDPDRDMLRQPTRLEPVRPGQVRITVHVDDDPDLDARQDDPTRDGLPALKKLEDQACRWTGSAKETSPDRVDALVHVLTWMLFPQRRASGANTPALPASDRWAAGARGDGRR